MHILFIDSINKRIKVLEQGSYTDDKFRALVDEPVRLNLQHLPNDYQMVLSDQSGFREHGFTFNNRRYYGNAVVVKFTGVLENASLDEASLKGLSFVKYVANGRARANEAFRQAAEAQQEAAKRYKQNCEARRQAQQQEEQASGRFWTGSVCEDYWGHLKGGGDDETFW